MAESEQILAALREQILRGTYPPGSRLPRREDLQKRYGASSHTVQRAIAELLHDGFVVARGRAGTFVTEQPPHLSRYAVVFPSTPNLGWTRFWQAVNGEATRLAAAGANLEVYYGIDGVTPSDAFRRLVDEVTRHRVAGIIFAAAPHALADTPVIREPGIARAAVMATPGYGMCAVYPDYDSFFARGIEWLAKAGRRRLAIVATDSFNPNDLAAVSRLAEKRKMSAPARWQFGVSAARPAWAENLAELLLSPNQRERPDALLIADDHLVEPVTAGVKGLGLKPGKDMDIVVHHNYPLAVAAKLPVTLLGFDVRQMLALCIDRINALRRGGKPAASTLVKALFENETAGEGERAAPAPLVPSRSANRS